MSSEWKEEPNEADKPQAYLPILEGLTPAEENTCHDCGVELTEANQAAALQIRQDGKTQGLCQNCYRADGVQSLDDILGAP